MDERVKIVFGLLGGLAMFLYGMNSMSDALQKAAGEKMKRILGFLTKNPLRRRPRRPGTHHGEGPGIHKTMRYNHI